MIFTSQDRESAMMITGEGFMIADSKTTTGAWNFRTFGTGRGFIADEIIAGTLNAGVVRILGTDQFYWDADNIYIYDPNDQRKQIRIGRYDGINYGIGFTQDSGLTWVSAFGFDGINLDFPGASIGADKITGLGDTYVSWDAANDDLSGFATHPEVADVAGNLSDLNVKLNQRIRFDVNGITIRQANDPEAFSSQFTSTSLDFYQGSDKIAWFANRALYVDNIKAAQRMSIGNFSWGVAGDGGVSLKYVVG